MVILDSVMSDLVETCPHILLWNCVLHSHDMSKLIQLQ